MTDEMNEDQQSPTWRLAPTEVGTRTAAKTSVRGMKMMPCSRMHMKDSVLPSYICTARANIQEQSWKVEATDSVRTKE